MVCASEGTRAGHLGSDRLASLPRARDQRFHGRSGLCRRHADWQVFESRPSPKRFGSRSHGLGASSASRQAEESL